MFTKLRPIKGRRAKQMMEDIVYLCLRVLRDTLVWAMAVKTLAVVLDRQADLSDVLTFAGAAFGGELLLLVLKRVFAKKSDTEDTYNG